MITLENYKQKTADFNFNLLPAKFKEGDKYVTDFGDLYNDDADIKEVIDLYLKEVNKVYDNFVKKGDAKPEKSNLAKVIERKEKEAVKKPVEVVKVERMDFSTPEKKSEPAKPKFKRGQTLWVKKGGKEVVVDYITKHGMVIPGQITEGTYRYSTNIDTYEEDELTDVKPEKKTKKEKPTKTPKSERNKKKNAQKKEEKINKPQVVFQGKYIFAKGENPIDVPIRATLNEGDWITFEYQNVTDTGKKVWWKIEDAYRVPRETMDIAIEKLKAKTHHHETKTEAKQRVVNAEQFIKDVEHNAALRNMTESQLIGLGLQFETNYRSYVSQKRDEGHDTKKRLTPTPENLIRWMKHPGHFDLIGVDTFQRTDQTADYKKEISKQKFWNNIFNIKMKA